MQLLYPIKAILMYFAILFAPADATKITVAGFNDSERIELVRAEGTWKAGANPVSVEGETFVVNLPDGKEAVKIRDFAALPGEQDWTKQPSFDLGGGSTLEKNAAGFIFKHNADGGKESGTYQVTYEVSKATAAAGGEFTVNVFGAVKTPGAYKIPAGGSILDALAAAGGWTELANLKKVSIIRGPAGEIPKVSAADANAILQGAGVAPPLIQRDTIMVPERVF